MLQAVLGYAGRLTCSCMQAAAGWYPVQQFASPAQPGTLERFYDKREAADQLEAPSWHKPIPEEVRIRCTSLACCMSLYGIESQSRLPGQYCNIMSRLLR